MTEMEGETREVANNFLGAGFWQPGTNVAGTVLRRFESANGLLYGLLLSAPVELNGVETSESRSATLLGCEWHCKPQVFRS